ncbi:MAG: GNAT family N-acetyltransferase [Chromatiales bacterium]|nr:GNAT family N-acetyltransferase [Chromatiales bacterium]
MTEYRLMTWTDAFAAYRAEWLALGIERGLNPTLLPDWSRIIVESLSTPADVRVLVGTDGPRLTSLLPFRLRRDRIRRIPVCILEPISSMVSYHAELVSREEPSELVRALLRTRDELGWDMVRLTGILEDSPTAHALRTVAREERLSLIHWPGEASPYLRIGMSGEKLVAGRDKRDRYLIRKHAKDFAATTGSSERWYGKDADVEELLTAMLHVEAGSWKKAAGVAISSDPRETEYYRRLLPWLSGEDQLAALVLFIHAEPVAYTLCYGWRGAYGCMKGTYQEEFARLAVGHHAQDQLVARIADAGAQEFDFLGDADPYKLAWSPLTRRHGDYFLYAPRGRGRWLGFLQRLRNRLRRRAGKPRDPDQV